jgi:hypothetical protein
MGVQFLHSHSFVSRLCDTVSGACLLATGLIALPQVAAQIDITTVIEYDPLGLE